MNKIIMAFLSIFLVFFSNFSVFAENQAIKTGDVLTLEECIDIAINNNPNITLAKDTTKIYQSKIGQAKSGYFPQLNLSTGYSRQNPTTTFGSDKSSNQYSGNVSLNQLIYDFGKTSAKVKIQDLNLDSSRLDVDNEVVLTAYNVKQAYFTALSSKINKAILAQAINQSEQHLKQAKAFFEAGMKSKIDVTTADVNLSNAKLNYIKANDAYKTAIANLNNAMGIPDAPEYNIADTIMFKNKLENEVAVSYEGKPTSNKPEDKSVLKSGITKLNIIDNIVFKKYDVNFEEAIKTAYDNRQDLKSLISKEAAAHESVKLAQKDYLPVLSGFAGYGLGGQKFPLDNGWSAGANVNVSVFNGFLTKNQINEAKANLGSVKSSVEILKQNIYLQVQQACISLTEAEKRLPVAEIIIKQAEENLELANGRYKVGVGNSIEVQDAEISYNSAQLAYVQTLYDYNIGRSNLEKAMGVK